jgi:hypothetical protein
VVVTGLGSRLLVGAIAGFVGTAAMTAAMRRLYRHLPDPERYPLPPREIEARTLSASNEANAENLTLLAHFAFGAGAGAALTARKIPGPVVGSALGTLVWLGSYMGWVPAAKILRPATRHPLKRNLLMIAVHLVWGSVTAATARDLDLARKTIFADGEIKDAP